MKITLSQLPIGVDGTIVEINAPHELRERLYGMGFIKGQRVKTIRRAPLRDPVVYLIKGSEISLREELSSKIVIESRFFSLDLAIPGEYVVDSLVGGRRFLEKMRFIGISKGSRIRVVKSLSRGKYIRINNNDVFIPYRQAMRIVVEELPNE
ncbi:MAG: ferrous iron transport protein A [Kosmotoga sp.]|uniref:FeoA family protein n=1 Tax=Kosmotoga sp. TaxID=1955248 RepID=UPI0025B8F44C|nr:FeoA family protein [Kosmotoga sp.]MCD6159572.1 ferrous iron transport protein A [Kosmotoga sp.]